MRDDIKKALIKAENKHYSAVQCDTQLNFLDNDDNRWYSLIKKSKLFWDDYQKAKKELIELLEVL